MPVAFKTRQYDAFTQVDVFVDGALRKSCITRGRSAKARREAMTLARLEAAEEGWIDGSEV